MSGNRCGHDPRCPALTPVRPIRKGKGGLPRILSLAAERAKAWYFHPKKCPPLQSHPKRKTRSERREACQVVLETILAHLDLASMCLGSPTLSSGFIDIDMRTIVRDSGMGQRRCERAIAVFKRAGFMMVTQPRTQNEEGAYFGCRAIRVVTEALFDWLGLGPMLVRERRRATAALRRKAQKANTKLTELMRRIIKGLPYRKRNPRQTDEEATRRWNLKCAVFFKEGLESDEARRRTNSALGYPPDYSPGHPRTPQPLQLFSLLPQR
ncbi:hypothetical protein LJC09_00850 [Desulfovibrio sp. OttesenSCG-928-F20]|nr:hypothetical protein [Desulfovibrio sp. OttesenSCG-928-M16]MDL2290641.1 hypothetical protein [Desulfovibrio sp. OttesenSCG-928-F20]